jgi:hypothetical protein
MPAPPGAIPFDLLTPDHVAIADEVIAFDDDDPGYRLVIPVEHLDRSPADTIVVLRVVLDHDWRDLEEAFLRTMALAASHAARRHAEPARDRVSP